MWNDRRVKYTQVLFILHTVYSPDRPNFLHWLPALNWQRKHGEYNKRRITVCGYARRTRDLLCGEWPAVSEAPTSLSIINLLCEESFATSDIGNEWQAGHGPRAVLGGGKAISTNWTESACHRPCVFSNDSDGTWNRSFKTPTQHQRVGEVVKRARENDVEGGSRRKPKLACFSKQMVCCLIHLWYMLAVWPTIQCSPQPLCITRNCNWCIGRPCKQRTAPLLGDTLRGCGSYTGIVVQCSQFLFSLYDSDIMRSSY
jgi:hypothetical protein